MTYGVTINYTAVLVASIVTFIIGFLWYGPIFGKIWIKLTGMTKKDIDKSKKKGMAKPIVLGFIGTLVTATILSIFIGLARASSFAAGIQLGFWIWLGFVATVTLGMVLWENKPWGLWLLNNAYQLITIALMAGIIAIW